MLAANPLPFPTPAASPQRRTVELPSFRPHRSSLHGYQSSSSSSELGYIASPLSLRKFNPSRDRGGTLESSSVRERRLSSQSIKPADTRPLSPVTLERPEFTRRPPPPPKVGSSEEMPPPSWTVKHARRQSLGVLPNSVPQATIPERRKLTLAAQVERDARRRTISYNAASPPTAATELQIRPRIVLPQTSYRYQTSASSNRSNVPRISPPISLRQFTTTPTSASHHSRWGSGGGGDPRLITRSPVSPSASSPRPSSPALSDGNSINECNEESSWWKRLSNTASLLSRSGSFVEEDFQAENATTRTRRHSLSGGEGLGIFRTASLPNEANQDSRARLASILSNHNAAASRPPRPRSVLTISSDSHIEHRPRSPSPADLLSSSRGGGSRPASIRSIRNSALPPVVDSTSSFITFPTTSSQNYSSSTLLALSPSLDSPRAIPLATEV